MEPITAMALMGAVQAAGGLANYFLQKGFNDQQQAQFKELYDEARQIQTPDLEAPVYDEYQAASPYEVQGYSPERSPYTAEGSLGIDEGARQRQVDVLNQLEDMYKSGGLDPQSIAAYNEAQMKVNQNIKSKRDAIMADAERSGRGGSNLNYLMQQQAIQDDANRLNQAGLQSAADARSRALSSMGMFGEQSAALRGQDFGQNQAIAKAKDVYNQFNTNNMNDAIRYKVGQQNQQAQNVYQNQQDVMNKNVGVRNQMADNVNKMKQQNYANELDKLGVVTGANKNYMGAMQDSTNAMTKGIGDVASGISGGINAYNKYSQDKDFMDYLKKKNGVV